jgi:hypothetical protein
VSAAVVLALAASPIHAETVARKWNEATLNSIRIDIPKPTVHARNLYHVSAAMWDAWCAYGNVCNGVLVTEKLTAPDIEAARKEAMSHAAYRLLKHRYRYGPGEETSQQMFDDLMDELGYDKDDDSTVGSDPAAVGNRIGYAWVEYGLNDGANEGPYMDYADDTGYYPVNPALIFDLPGCDMNDPNRWQALAFDFLVLQNGIIIGAAIQEFLNPNWGKVEPWAFRPHEQEFPWVYYDTGPPPRLGGDGDAQFKAEGLQNILLSSYADPTDGAMMDIGPGAIHNNPLGTHGGTGRAKNPHTGMPYEPNIVPRGDYARVVAEFWADGPDSETPPGHWNTLANYVTDHPELVKRFKGKGPILDDLEWEIKLYLALNGAVHDAAIAAWGLKGHYDYSRPISHIRWMCQEREMGTEDGIPLVDGMVEMITAESSAPGERHEHLANYVGEVALWAWLGAPEDPETEIGGVGWMRCLEWMPYQAFNFVTPPFAGYISGHSTFSRAAAEVMAKYTGDKYFPGGMGIFDAYQNEYLEFELGPSVHVQLQWATYFDASDEAGISRLYGGIHPWADDWPGRITGAIIGQKAIARAIHAYGSGKLQMCHHNGSRSTTIKVRTTAADLHLEHGDEYGPCQVVDYGYDGGQTNPAEQMEAVETPTSSSSDVFGRN